MACGQQWFCIGSFWFSQVLKVPSALFPVVFQQLQQFRLSGFSPVLTVRLASSGKLIAFGKVKRLTRLQKAHWINCSNVYQWGYIFDLSDSTYYLNKKKMTLHFTLYRYTAAGWLLHVSLPSTTQARFFSKPTKIDRDGCETKTASWVQGRGLVKEAATFAKTSPFHTQEGNELHRQRKATAAMMGSSTGNEVRSWK